VTSCPQNEVLAGGGLVNSPSAVDAAALAIGWPLTTDGLLPGTPPTWHVGLKNSAQAVFSTFSNAIVSQAICLQVIPPLHVRFNFSNYHHLLRIPADVIVATDGSGQLKATLVTTSVTQVQSGPIDASQSINPFTGGVTYSVPAALTAQLERAVPTGRVAFGSPSVSINRDSLTCSPAAGTQRSAPFTYTQAIDGSASQGTYYPGDVFTYQMQQLQAAARQLGSPYVLGNTLVCPPGPSVQSATATRATIECAAYGVAEWPWSDQALRALAAQLADKTPSQALAILNATPGIEPGSATIALPSGVTITNLSTNPADITLLVATKQDTAPVLRTP
jgi:hypothetical protein